MISIAGKMYPCRITMGALARFKRLAGHDVDTLDSGDIEELLLFVWCCIASACVADKVTFEISPEELPDHVTPDALADFMAVMSPAEKKTMPEATGNRPISTD